jgi:hypothetical protein
VYLNSYKYKKDTVYWAEPCIEDASIKLLKIYNNYYFYKNRVKTGKEWIKKNYSIEEFALKTNLMKSEK